jgi:hypothetical protein
MELDCSVVKLLFEMLTLKDWGGMAAMLRVVRCLPT